MLKPQAGKRLKGSAKRLNKNITCNGISLADFTSQIQTVQSAEADISKLSSENQQSVYINPNRKKLN